MRSGMEAMYQGILNKCFNSKIPHGSLDWQVAEEVSGPQRLKRYDNFYEDGDNSLNVNTVYKEFIYF